MLDEVISIINKYEAQELTESQALSEINELTGKEVDSYGLNNYWRAESLEDFARELATPPISDWKQIDDARAMQLISEILEDVCDSAIVNRNMEALEKRYRKPVSDLVFDEDLSPEQILEKLKVDSTIYL